MPLVDWMQKNIYFLGGRF